MKRRPVAVVVVGDLARSPRMLNHARELARVGAPVVLIGNRQHEFTASEGVEVHVLRSRSRVAAKSALLFLAGSGVRMGVTFFELLAALRRIRPGVILVQNPPSFPTLLAGWLAARWLRARLVIDWHNYGFSMLGLRLGAGHRFTRLAAAYEMLIGRRADGHLCVSDAMRKDLEQQHGIHATVVYDRPLWRRETAYAADGDRLVAVCPSGWTADEDMEMLLEALEGLAGRNIEVHLTGAGPRRAALEPRIQALRDAGMSIHTGYLSENEYWSLLGRAAIGLSLHRSSSGLDLAMKVVDLFSAGVPVCAFDYGPTLREQVSPGETGFVFRNAAELAELLSQLERDPSPLAAMRRNITADQRTWSEEWARVADQFDR